MKNYRPFHFSTLLAILAVGSILNFGCSGSGGGGGNINPNNPNPPVNGVGIDAKGHACFSRPYNSQDLVINSSTGDGYFLAELSAGEVLQIQTTGFVSIEPVTYNQVGPAGIPILYPGTTPHEQNTFIGGGIPGSTVMYARDESGALVHRPTFIGSNFTVYHTNSRKFKYYACIWDGLGLFGDNSGTRAVTVTKSKQTAPYKKTTTMVDIETDFGYQANGPVLLENFEVLANDRLLVTVPGGAKWTANAWGAVAPVYPIIGHDPFLVGGNPVQTRYPTSILGFPAGFFSTFAGSEWWGSLGLRTGNTYYPVSRSQIVRAPSTGDTYVYPVNSASMRGLPGADIALGSTWVSIEILP